MILADISIKRFMLAMFNGEKEGIDDWENIFISYVDLSGASDTRKYYILVSIHNIEVRLHAIDFFVQYQKEFFNLLGRPDVDVLSDMNKYGHRLTYNGDVAAFNILLNKMLSKEKRRVTELNILNKELSDLNKSQPIKEGENARQDFIRQLNLIGKVQGFAIDRNTTDMETFCLMIKQYKEDCEYSSTK